jgi:type II secretory ATPase GspE/PulE/Tfp pilus assembly ATPase PilB-like protein
MGIDAYLVASSLEAVLAQRLVRTICPQCKVPRSDTDVLLEQFAGTSLAELLGSTPLYIGSGCEMCKQSGYRGRTGIYELLLMDNTIRPLVMEHAPASDIRTQASLKGMHSLREDGWEKVAQGITTVEEVLRVTRQEDLELSED